MYYNSIGIKLNRSCNASCEICCFDCTNHDDRIIDIDYVKRFIESAKENDEIKANLNYGKELVDFVKSEENVRIRRFECNIEKMFKTNKLEPLTCFIVFKKIKGDIMTEQFTSIGSALKNFQEIRYSNELSRIITQ